MPSVSNSDKVLLLNVLHSWIPLASILLNGLFYPDSVHQQGMNYSISFPSTTCCFNAAFMVLHCKVCLASILCKLPLHKGDQYKHRPN